MGVAKFHLSCDFECDDDGVLCVALVKCVKKMINVHQQIFGSKPSGRKICSPLEKGDHPELDTGELLEGDDVQKCQSLIRATQWAVSLGRMDIAMAVASLSGFRVTPRSGHMDRIKRFHSCLSDFKQAMIGFCVGEPVPRMASQRPVTEMKLRKKRLSVDKHFD